jgi:hypothetical protein
VLVVFSLFFPPANPAVTEFDLTQPSLQVQQGSLLIPPKHDLVVRVISEATHGKSGLFFQPVAGYEVQSNVTSPVKSPNGQAV